MAVKTKALSEKLVHVARTKPVSVPESSTLGEALAVMRETKIHCLMVCRGKKLVGIFTERDYLMKAAGKADPAESIKAYMTPDPVIVTLEQTVGEAVETMNAKGLRNLPVVDEAGSPASLVTVNTIIKYLAGHFPAAVVTRPPQPHMVTDQTDGA